MKVFILVADPEYLSIETMDDHFDFFWNLLDSKPIKTLEYLIKWKTIKEKKDVRIGDFPFFMVPVLSSKAYLALKNEFIETVEFFPFAPNKKYGQFYFLNITNIIDGLDLNKSKIKYFSDGNIMRVEQYYFNKNILSSNTNIFKIKGIERGDIFVNEKTKKLIEDAGLEGFIFTQVWDSENPEFVYEPRKIL